MLYCPSPFKSPFAQLPLLKIQLIRRCKSKILKRPSQFISPASQTMTGAQRYDGAATVVVVEAVVVVTSALAEAGMMFVADELTVVDTD